MLKVSFDRGQEIIHFPDVCAYCCQESPTSTYGLKYGNIISDLLLDPFDFILPANFEVPACEACLIRWKWNRRLHWLGTAGILIAVVAILESFKVLFPNVWQPQNIQGFKWLVITGIILIGIPFYGFIMKLLPLPVTVTRNPQNIEFTFLDDVYGELFAESNDVFDNEELCDDEEDVDAEET